MLLYVVAGGALGTAGRYLIGSWALSWTGTGFPWGTLTINVLGSFVLGVIVGIASLKPMTPEMGAFLTVGICGGFTTFSAYSHETFALLASGAWTRGAAYAMGSVVLGLVAIYVGTSVTQVLLTPSS